MGVKVTTKFDLIGIKKILTSDRKTLDEIGRFAALRIETFTRSGKTLALGDEPKKLNDLELSTIRTRRLAKRNGTVDLSPFFRPTKSNLTFTGQLLDSLQWSITEDNQVIVEVGGQRDDGETNEQIAEYVSEGGRPFMGMDLNGIKRINNIVNRALRRRLKAYNK